MTPEAVFELCEITDASAQTRLADYVRLLLDENTRINLTATRDVGEFWSRHIVDSLAALPFIDPATTEKVADLGTGGGLPGIPLACVMPEVRFVLIDSTQKKIAALERIVAAMGIPNVEFVGDRAENIGRMPKYREKFEVVTTRAVGKVAQLVEWCSGLLAVDGQCLIYKLANGLDEELKAAEKAAAQCQLDFETAFEYDIPENDIRRALVIYSKVDALPARLPRPASAAKGKPLL
ncbi:MAG: 16S rRNA (guanine(527)-N(7))-methyltransferase RsmG [Phycisphaerae bacterium]